MGPERSGDVGRDILIVRRALGSIVDFQSLVDSREGVTIENPEGWFDCSTGTSISNLEAATFDKSMLTYLTKFQLDNQFYILCYLFTKFSINENFETINEIETRASVRGSFSLSPGGKIPVLDDHLNNQYMNAQLDIITRMFEIEFGTLGEATLAVLHGWRPRTRVGNTSYHHDPRVFSEQDSAYDMVLVGLFDAFHKGLLSQDIRQTEDLIEPKIIVDYSRYLGDENKGKKFLKKYKSQVSKKESIQFSTDSEQRPEDYIIESVYFVGMRYEKVLEESQSPLYAAFLEVSNEMPRPQDSFLMSEEDYTDSLLRAFEPDPLQDPEPFQMDSSRIGFFDRTEYTLENLPPRFSTDSTPEEVQIYQQEIKKYWKMQLYRGFWNIMPSRMFGFTITIQILLRHYMDMIWKYCLITMAWIHKSRSFCSFYG